MTTGVVVGLLLSTLASQAKAQSSSLWALAGDEAAPVTLARTTDRDAGPPVGNPILDAASFIAVRRPTPRRFKPHDIVTVIVNEAKRSQVRSSLEQEKEFKLDAALQRWFRIHDGKIVPAQLQAGQPGAGIDFQQEWEGDGEFRRDEQLVTRVPAKVVDVMPNGNLILAGRKYIKEEDEERILTLTGECRSADILPDNTILSTQVANLVIDAASTGAVRDASRRGWIPRGLDFLRPF